MPLPPENVQDYPRPPALEGVAHRLWARLGGAVVAETHAGLRVCETHHAPTYYFPPADVQARLTPAGGGSVCEWKGRAQYFDVTAGGVTARRAAWCYPAPTQRFAALAGYLAFYPGALEAAGVGDAPVRPQPGDFYGGWITDNLSGTVKGAPGTEFW
ncbi:DUF427 domain-containing protein [Rhodobaculum claviforme]|uniref:DUF427 domain-containing protein n=1 Tax=Rhodobaculum claviforme TaxID=1549854 RepID=A0A934TMB3_9RHOB|nr:DUF427 domain-containing protein [Rhodobaculum claviforme]MBK5928759.1 hypothetical protein [Rhodobaculum claviforme]